MTQQPTSGELITKELLFELMPVIQHTSDDSDAVSARRAERAKQRLYAAAYPLIVDIARKEYQRRQQWNSAASMDDLIQDGSIGLFKALSGFDLDAMGSSATHYLGQWILVSMRRGAESLDHDFQIGHDQGQKFRKIRAIRSRLHGELGREPSIAEIVEASQESGHQFSGTYLGAKNRSSRSSGVSENDVREEIAYRERVGTLERVDATAAGDEDGPGVQLVDMSADPGELVAEDDSHEQVRALVSIVIATLDIEDTDRDIIARHYGLAPYSSASSLRAIARDLDINRDRVGSVVRHFNDALKQPGGVLFELLDSMSSDDRTALGVDEMWEQLLPVSDANRSDDR